MDKIAELLKSISNNCKKLDKDCNNILENNNRVLSNNKKIEKIKITEKNFIRDEYDNDVSLFFKINNKIDTNSPTLDFIINLMEKNHCDYWVDGNEIGFYNNTEYTIFTEDVNEIKKISDTKYILREQEEYILIDFKNQKIDWIE